MTTNSSTVPCAAHFTLQGKVSVGLRTVPASDSAASVRANLG